MGRVILTNVSVYSEVIDTNVYGFLDCPGNAMPLPDYYAELFHGGLVASGGIMAMYGSKSL